VLSGNFNGEVKAAAKEAAEKILHKIEKKPCRSSGRALVNGIKN
jgi:hypothetical protein